MSERQPSRPCGAPPGEPSWTSAVARDRIPSRSRAAEFILLYAALPAVLWAFRDRVPILPVLWLAAGAAFLHLRRDGGFASDPSFSRDRALSAGGRLAARFALCAAILAGGLHLLAPELWLALPRRSPGLWLAAILLYPLVSVVPQGVIYRALFYHRYAGLFGGGWRSRAVGAVAFAWCHIVFDNYWAVALTLAGGWFFCGTYERTRSRVIANLEHALYGAAIFTLGLGEFFYRGTQGFAARLLALFAR